MVEQRLADIDFGQLCSGRTYFESPRAWEEEVLYFFLPDRFSDGKEQSFKDIHGNLVTTGTTPLYTDLDNGNAIKPPNDPALWREAGGKWVGGTLQGIKSKLGYLKRMGITAIWLGPIFKQVDSENSYHGYGIQNFLDVDPHFGSREDLKDLVEAAHQQDIRIIMDIIINHTGNVFNYSSCRYWDDQGNCDHRWDSHTYESKPWKGEGDPNYEFAAELTENTSIPPHIWPAEFQNKKFYNLQGRINNWDYPPEYLQGDFFNLKDINLQDGTRNIDQYQPTEALKALCKVYQFWIAYADVDGFRIDTVKHCTPGAVRYFASAIHEFTQSIGKEKFYLIGEITGGRKNAFDTMELTGLDAALGIDDVQVRLANMIKGDADPSWYFNLFRNSLQVDKESHTWFRDKVVIMIDDHDKVPQGENKSRFCAFVGHSKVAELALNALAVNVTTMGIPCIYYGTEQNFDGEGKGSDKYIREAMFGGNFGAFRSRDRHFFNEDRFTYQELAQLLKIRSQNITLLRGRQYLRKISGNGTDFGEPSGFGGKVKSVVAWSRIFNDNEVLVAFNTDPDNSLTAWVNIDHDLHQKDDKFECIYCSNDKSQIGQQLSVEAKRNNELNALKLTLPACGFVIYEKVGKKLCSSIPNRVH